MELRPTRLNTTDIDFSKKLREMTAWEAISDLRHEKRVLEIISEIRMRGDDALLQFTREFDKNPVKSVEQLILKPEKLEQAFLCQPKELQNALEIACERVWTFHKAQKESSWRLPDRGDGMVLGQEVRPMQRVGLYVPGGKAAYPSTVLMNTIPAKVAKVPMVQMVVPAPLGEVNSIVLAAAHLAKVDRVITIGGAQAIAALAYGTETVLPVDKIVGPGNAWVATAKRHVFGKVGIDMIAGPSEILVYVEPPMNPDWVAMDLFSQAEHDEQAQPILVCSNADYIDQVLGSMEYLIPSLERADIIKRSIDNRCLIIKTQDRKDALQVINQIAPEHLELCVDDPDVVLASIDNAGAIFMGRYTPEALGDYCAGPNHVLPTSGTARFASPLGVYDFIKRSSVIYGSKEGSASIAKVASTLANSEGLTAHARSAEYRR